MTPETFILANTMGRVKLFGAPGSKKSAFLLNGKSDIAAMLVCKGCNLLLRLYVWNS